MRKYILVLLATVFAVSSQAQVKIPPISSSAKVEQGLGIHKITLNYHRPNMNNRKIFGDLIPFNEIWRTGANQATVVDFQGDVQIDGRVVKGGSYALFTIPNPDSWTVILSSNTEQWGSYTYNPDEDVVRFEVKPEKTLKTVETLTISFEEVTPTSAQMQIAWEDTQISFAIVADQQKEIVASIEQAMQSDKKPYLAAAQYYYNNNLDIKRASEWVQKAVETTPELPWVYFWKARIFAKAGNKQEALQAATQGIEVAKKADNDEYIRLNTQMVEELK